MTAPQDRPQDPYGQPPPPVPDGPPPRKGLGKGLSRGLIAGVVVVAMVAVAVVYFYSGGGAGTGSLAGDIGGPAGTASSGSDAQPDAVDPREGEIHALEEINRQGLKTHPKEDGYPSGADPELIRISSDAIYTLSHTEKTIDLTSFGLEKNEIRWEQRFPVKNDGSISRIEYTVVEGALLLQVDFTNRTFFTKVLDPATGEQLWSDQFPALCSFGCVYGNRLMRTGESGQERIALDIRTGEKVWAVPQPTDEPAFTWIRQETAESMNASDAPQGFTERYVAQGQKGTGLTRIIDTETGEIVSEAVVGEKVMDYLLVGEVLYVYRQTPRDLKAYSIKDLSTPLWTEQLPAAQDGSAMVSCHVTVLCLILLDGSGQLLRGVEQASGKTLWETRDHQDLDRTEMRYVGGPVMLQAGGTTVLLDAVTGEPIEQFASQYFFYLGASVALIWEGAEVVAFDVAKRDRLDLGPALGTEVVAHQCHWDEAYAACGHEAEKEFSIWRYRG
jgi:outer membrane protein assembly factor BamB